MFILFDCSQWALNQIKDSAPLVTASQIRNLQSDENNECHFVIVDVRSKAETDVSMIPGALTKSEFERGLQQHYGKSVIVYCTIGFRSGIYAASLKRKGWKAWNYKGSILDWCGNNLPLTLAGKETNRVHTYNRWLSAPENYIAVY